MKVWTYNENELGELASIGMRLALRTLVDKKLIDAEVADQFVGKHSIILVTSENTHKRWWEKIYSWEKLKNSEASENGRFVVIEIHGPQFDKDPDDE